MSEKIYYVVFFEGNMFQAFGDFLSGGKCINKEGPFLFEKEAAERSMRHTRACIVYNAVKQSFLNDIRHANYAYDAVHNLIAWAKKNIPIITRRKSVVGILETIPEYPCETSPDIITGSLVTEPSIRLDTLPLEYVFEPAVETEPLVETEPIVPDAIVPDAIVPDAIVPENELIVVPAPSTVTPSLARWCFFEQNSIHHEQEDLNIKVEIGNIADKVFTSIKAYGGDFLSIANLAKGITFNMGLGMANSKDVSEILKEIEDMETGGTPSFLIIKLEKKKSSNKISVPGFFSRNKKASLFTVEYSFFKPKNAAAHLICEDLLNTKIQHKINFLKTQTA